MPYLAKLEALVRGSFALDLDSPYHGVRHWQQVRTYGEELAQATGADAKVVRMFAMLHDSRRYDEADDPEHGKRAARWTKALWQRGFPGICDLSISQLAKLASAIEGHSDGYTTDDITVGTCWDADRLDLGRVGIMPVPRLLSTKYAKQMVIHQPQLFAPAPRAFQEQAHNEIEPSPGP